MPLKTIIVIVFYCFIQKVSCQPTTIVPETSDDIILDFNVDDVYANEEFAQQFMDDYNVNLTKLASEGAIHGWNYETNITSFNEKLTLRSSAAVERFQRELHPEIKRFKTSRFNNPKLKRMFKDLELLGTAALGPENATKFNNVILNMQEIYSTAKICVNNRCNLTLEPDVTDIMSHERNWTTLKETWKNWRDATGKVMRPLFLNYIDLGREAAVKNNLSNYGDFWLRVWDDEGTGDLRQDVLRLWNEMKPLYLRLHAYVRMKLRRVYGDQMPPDGTIPAHITGNMWGQSWSEIFDTILAPYPSSERFNVESELRRQNYDTIRMFRTAEDFFVSLGLEPMTGKFWNHSMLEKPSDGREVVCHASAWDFYSDDDFRVKMCTQLRDFFVIHHEMGHIQYFMLYRHQPHLFRDGANPGFHEAIGDTISYSVLSPDHLKKIGLLQGNFSETRESLINYQMKLALDTISFLPFSIIMDFWRLDVFSGRIGTHELNRKWWDLRIRYQGISPPVNRSEDDLDPGSKSHTSNDYSYIAYFFAKILTFQFHEALCQIKGQTENIHNCDVYGNQDVGNLLKQVLSQGSSVPWPKQLKQLTGSDKVSAQPMIKFFEPLYDYLESQLLNEQIGWRARNARSYFPPDDERDTRTIGRSSRIQQQQIDVL